MAILNFGSFIIDHVYQVPHFVRPGETLPAADYRIFAGGKGFNQTVALARAGVAVRRAGVIGGNGQWLLELLSAILQYPGANRTIARDHVDRMLTRFGAGDVLVLQNKVNDIGYLVERAMQRAAKAAAPRVAHPDVAASIPHAAAVDALEAR